MNILVIAVIFGNHCDLLSHLQASISANETNHAWMHVPAHQIRKKSARCLTRNALLNKEMDSIASWIMEAYPSAAPFNSTVDMPTVHYGKIIITGNIQSSLYHHLTRQPVRQYLESRNIIGPGTYDTVAWEAIHKARGWKHNLDMRLSKLICNQLPTLQTLHRWKQVISNKCPFCKTKVEDRQHIYRWSHLAWQEQWNGELQKLALWLQNQSTEPGIRQMLITMIQW